MNTQTHTRRALIATVTITLAVLLLGTCYWNPQSGVGKITLNLSSGSRAQVDPTVVQYARAYLYADNMNNRINLDGATPYAEATMSASGGSMTVDHVPAGSGYQLVLTLGTKPDGSHFVPGKFGTSSTFDVTANHETSVSIASVQSAKTVLSGAADVQYDLLGKDLNGVAYPASGNLGATDAGTLYRGAIGSMTGTGLGGFTANSLSSFTDGSGVAFFSVNTTNGIQVFKTTGGNLTSSTAPFSLPSAPTGSILQSGYYTTGNTYYYQGPGVLGGESGGNPWANVDLSGAVSGQPVLDFALGGGTLNGFFASKVGAFAIGVGLVSGGAQDLDYVITNGEFFHVSKGGRNLFIRTVAVNASILYVGTTDGIYQQNVSSFTANFDFPIPVSSVLPGSTGESVKKILFSTYLVALCDNVVLVYKSGVGSQPISIPVSGVTLGDLRAIAINAGMLYIAGSEGVTAVALN